jgi:hypothetical protein
MRTNHFFGVLVHEYGNVRVSYANEHSSSTGAAIRIRALLYLVNDGALVLNANQGSTDHL